MKRAAKKNITKKTFHPKQNLNISLNINAACFLKNAHFITKKHRTNLHSAVPKIKFPNSLFYFKGS